MDINFKGFNDPTGPVAELMRTAVEFLADHLMGDAHKGHAMDIVILGDHFITDDNLAATTTASDETDIMGAVFIQGGDYDTADKPTFTMGVHPSADPATLFMIIAHEMVHVKQYVMDELRTVVKDGDITNHWMGEVFDSPDVDYMDLPWEVEAYARQEDILFDLISHPPFQAAIAALA